MGGLISVFLTGEASIFLGYSTTFGGETFTGYLGGEIFTSFTGDTLISFGEEIFAYLGGDTYSIILGAYLATWTGDRLFLEAT